MKKNLQIMALSLLFGGTPAFAEGFLVFSIGLMPDLGMLGETIAKDGLNSIHGKPTMIGAEVGTGCASAPNPALCKTEMPGNFQTVVFPENTLVSLERNTAGIISTRDSGAMTGLVVNLMYESQSENTFWRTGVSYTRKVLGGETESHIVGIKWYDVHWDYSAYSVPIYFGIKTDSSAPSSMYGAIGLHYYDAGFSVGGMNNGEIPTSILGSATGPIGTSTVINSEGKPVGGALLSEDAKFRSRGIGIGALFGAEKKLESGNKIFLEVNHIFSGGMANGNTRDAGGMSHISPFPNYPVVFAGTVITFGLKKAL